MSSWYTKGAVGVANGSIDFLTDTIKVLLVDSDYVFAATHNFVSDVVAEELSGSGYVRKTLASKAVSEDDANTRAEFDAADVTWTAINAGTAKGAIIFKDTGADATAPLIAYIDSGGFPKGTNGSDLTIQWDAEGILQLDIE